MTIGEKLQTLRKARGWSQEELAQQINVSRQALSKWEQNASVPDTENVVALSRLFGVTTDYLLLETPEAFGTAGAAADPKWPLCRKALLIIGIVGAIGLVALYIWASVQSPVELIRPSSPSITLSGMKALLQRYPLHWLLWLLRLMLLGGGIGAFYQSIRKWFICFFRDGEIAAPKK